MSALSLASPFPIFTDIDGNPLEDGYIYVGTAGLNPETNPISVYWDAALTVPAAQPIRTLGGYPSRSGTAARMYVNADDCSTLVRNKNGSLIFSALNVTDQIPSGAIGFIQVGANAVPRTAQDKLRERVSVADFDSFADALIDIGATPTTLVVDTAVVLGGITTIPANVSIVIELGGSITQGAHSLAINGPFSAPRYQVFSGAGLVTFGQGSADEAFPEWWQTNTTPGTTDMAAAINAALATGRPVKLDKGIYRANTSVIVNTGGKLTGAGLALTALHSYAAASPCVASTLAALSDSCEITDFNVIVKGSGTAGFDLSTARNSRFNNLQVAMNERTGGGGCTGFKFGKSVPAAGNYRNNLSNSYSFDTGATSASSVSLVVGQSGDGANANNFENVILDGSNRAIVMTDSVGCHFYGCHAMNAVVEAVLLNNSPSNSFDLYVENCPAAGTVDLNSINNSFDIWPDAGVPTALAINNSQCYVKNRIQQGTQQQLSNSVISDVAVKDWTGTASKDFGKLIFDGVEGAAIVKVVTGGVTAGAGGGASTAEFVITFVNSTNPVVTAIAAAATAVGTAGAITATPSTSGGDGVVTFAAVAHPALQNSFLIATEVLHVTHTGAVNTVYGTTKWERV